ncbi:MAG: phospho-sugar mutase [Planctomycetaceae bacterium]|nr:phospho-sugar mutase [Planctomycetaceae bacterium]
MSTEQPTIPDLIEAAVNRRELSPSAASNLKTWLDGPAGREDLASRERVLTALKNNDAAWLEPLFWEVIPFGTGGRRGPMADFGTATLNRRTVAESADGLARYLRSQNDAQTEQTVIIAYDSRHRSEEFARLTATVLAGNGLNVLLFPEPRATPELSFGVRHWRCAAGVMISASHNPPSDNGVKMYWSDGGQVLPPHDRGIIDAVMTASQIPLADYEELLASGRIRILDDNTDQAYLAAIVRTTGPVEPGNVRILYSPLHGVGESSIARALEAAGCVNLEIFALHRAVDGGFPNVSEHLPNPELPKVFEPLRDRAREWSADVVMATDPDADRLGALLPDRDGNFHYISGNRLAVLLADHALRHRATRGTLTPDDYLVLTLVTTPLVTALGRSHGVRVIDQLLVGFKHIGATIEREGAERFLFGCEESHGYLAGDYCRDKDAAVAAVLLAQAVAMARACGDWLWERFDAIEREHGVHEERQVSLTRRGSAGQAEIRKIMRAMCEAPPPVLGECHVEFIRDYESGTIRSPAGAHSQPLDGPRGQLVFFDGHAGSVRVSVGGRPSGTEPKIKFYLFAQADVPLDGDLAKVRADASEALNNLERDLREWVDTVCEAP